MILSEPLPNETHEQIAQALANGADERTIALDLSIPRQNWASLRGNEAIWSMIMDRVDEIRVETGKSAGAAYTPPPPAPDWSIGVLGADYLWSIYCDAKLAKDFGQARAAMIDFLKVCGKYRGAEDNAPRVDESLRALVQDSLDKTQASVLMLGKPVRVA